MSGQVVDPKLIRVSELEERLKAVLTEVATDHVTYVVEDGSRPGAAVIPYQELLRLQGVAQREQERLRRWDQSRARLAARNAHFTDEEIEADVKAAITEVRAEQRAKERDAKP